jgi:hypothetical protein
VSPCANNGVTMSEVEMSAWRGALLLLSAVVSACSGDAGGSSTPNPASGGNGGSSGAITPQTWQPVTPCEPVAPTRVTRLSDRHYANSVRDLLGLTEAPVFETSSSSTELFLPNKAAPVTGAVALKMRDLLESLSLSATAPGSAFVACSGDERACATSFINSFAGRAFRHALSDQERTELFTVYDSGKLNYGGTHAAGIRLVIEAVLQAPAFVYQSELGAGGTGRRALTPHELAAKLSYFLIDSVPDLELWQAADSGQLTSDAQISVQVERLLQTPQAKANLTQIFLRMFQLDRIFDIGKAASVTEFTPALVASMHEETSRFIDATLWNRDATLNSLLTSRETSIDAALAPLYGLPAPAASGFTPVTLPAAQRAGILTQASIMTMEARPDDSSVIHRGVFIVRELLCFHPPPPQPSFLTMAAELDKVEPTERGRALKRQEMPVCTPCHRSFDPFGITFENYDTLGRYRTTIEKPEGSFPVDASWDFDLYDMQGHVENAIQLSERLASSGAVRECMSRQLASYALGQRLTDEQSCGVADLSQRFTQSGGNLLELVKLAAIWPGLSQREEAAP